MAAVPELEQVIGAIERDHADTGLDARLLAAVGVAGDLRVLGDQLLDHYVQAARAGGSSWTEIGAVLGVSKQGAQQRYSATQAATVRPWPSGFSTAAQAVVTQAVDEARALGHRYVGTEHVLLGLLTSEGGLAERALTHLGVTHDVVHARVVELIGRGEHAGETLAVTPRTKRVFEAARHEAKRAGHRCPEPEHVLLALFAVSQGVAGEILESAGASEGAVRSVLADMLDGEAPELAERIRHPRRRRRSRR
jgi:hypothetical protein